MTATPARTDRSRFDHADAAAAVALATRAPSIHNTQPWSWTYRDGVVSLRADRSRQLRVADPDGHSLMISCGAALALTRLGLQLRGYAVSVLRVPDPADPDLLAEMRVLRWSPASARDEARADAAMHRRSERRPFGPGEVTDDQIERMRQAAASERVFAHFPVRSGEELDLAVAVSDVDRVLLGDEAYRAEVASWVRADGDTGDGVPVDVIPRVGAEPRHTDVPLRDFELGTSGSQLIATGVDERPLLAIVFTDSDQPEHQLAAGEAMMLLMLEAETLGLSTCALSQAVDMLAFRAHLRTMMSWTSYPQMILRIGPRPAGDPAPLTNRRPVDDLLH